MSWVYNEEGLNFWNGIDIKFVTCLLPLHYNFIADDPPLLIFSSSDEFSTFVMKITVFCCVV